MQLKPAPGAKYPSMTNLQGILITPYIPFPDIRWWQYALRHNVLCFDNAEHYQKMSYRNRYYIPGSNGVITLSIPLADGRNQRNAMKEVRIANRERWQVQHWRTLTSVYKRTPFFEFYEPSLQTLFETEYEYLCRFNLDSIHWVKKQLKLNVEETFADEYIAQYPNAKDLRGEMIPAKDGPACENAPEYYQVFADRTGFIPNMSVLDLLFCEGPNAMAILKGK